MAYIGYNPSQLAIAPFATKYFTGDGTTTTFTLDQSVPGANEANVEVFVENVQQNPVDAYTIGGALNNSLIFSEAPVTGGAIYVIHKGEATYNLQPATGSVTATTLDPVLRNFTVDKFTGDGSTKTFTLTDTPYSPNSVLVVVDGITQTSGTNYNVTGTTLTFDVAPTASPDNGSNVTVVHLGFSSGNKAVMDASITPVKLSLGGPWWSTGGILAVGTTSPTSSSGTKLDVFSSTATISTAIRSTFSTGSAQLLLAGNNTTIGSGEFLISHDGTATAYLYNRSNTPMIFGTNNIERVRIDSRGKVGIGNSAPSNWKTTWAALDIGQAASFYSQDNNTTGIGSNLYFTGSVWGRKNTGLTALYQLSEGVHYWYSNPTGAADSTFSPNTVMQLETNGQLTLPFGQIKFPAAQNASSDPNTLDDYEEGTFEVVIVGSGGGTATGASGPGSGGTYIKIGKKVYCQFYFANPTITGTLSGDLRFNLPLAIANATRFDNGSAGVFVATRDISSGSTSTLITLQGAGGTAYANLRQLFLGSRTESSNLTQATANIITSTLLWGNFSFVTT
jgi:hypothetical protein